MPTTRVGYSLTRRTSQSRAGLIYQDIIRQRYQLGTDTEKADVVIIQHPAWHYHLSYAMNPFLRERYVIAYCVAHAEEMPVSWKRSLDLVQEVWSCSDFCCDVFAKYHPNVVKVPYVVERDTSVSDEVLAFVKQMIGYDPANVYFLSLGPVLEPRKNLPGLVASFTKIAKSMPNARLVIKASPDDQPAWPSHKQVILLPMTLPHEYINALYHLANVYVNAHHAESWGMTISDALLFNKPVIATGYSGNLEYMDPADSFLLSHHPDTAPSNTRGISIEGGMPWCTPDPASLEENLLKLYATHNSPEVQEKVARAARRAKSFNRARAAEIIYRRIDQAAGTRATAEPSVLPVASSIA